MYIYYTFHFTPHVPPVQPPKKPVTKLSTESTMPSKVGVMPPPGGSFVRPCLLLHVLEGLHLALLMCSISLVLLYLSLALLLLQPRLGHQGKIIGWLYYHHSLDDLMKMDDGTRELGKIDVGGISKVIIAIFL